MSTSRQLLRWALTAAVALALVATVLGLVSDGGGTSARRTSPEAGPPMDQAAPAVAASPEPAPKRAGCTTAVRPLAPRRIVVPGVPRGVPVVTPPRDANNVPGVAPLTRAGTWVFAWDREQGIRPGDPAGNVLLNAHTWPDGTALGNRLLAELHRGDRIVVRGGRAQLCYRVTERVEVLATRGMPRYYDRAGPPQLAIIVCSGRRLGPGVWEKRTIWFASPEV